MSGQYKNALHPSHAQGAPSHGNCPVPARGCMGNRLSAAWRKTAIQAYCRATPGSCSARHVHRRAASRTRSSSKDGGISLSLISCGFIVVVECSDPGVVPGPDRIGNHAPPAASPRRIPDTPTWQDERPADRRNHAGQRIRRSHAKPAGRCLFSQAGPRRNCAISARGYGC